MMNASRTSGNIFSWLSLAPAWKNPVQCVFFTKGSRDTMGCIDHDPMPVTVPSCSFRALKIGGKPLNVSEMPHHFQFSIYYCSALRCAREKIVESGFLIQETRSIKTLTGVVNTPFNMEYFLTKK